MYASMCLHWGCSVIYSAYFLYSTVLDYRDKIWKNLRDSYVRVLSGRNYKSMAFDSGDVSKFPHLEPLSFLKIYINRRKSTSSKKLFQESSDSKSPKLETKSESDEDQTMSDHTEMLTGDNDVPLSMAERIPTTTNPEPEVEENGLRSAKRPFLQVSPGEQEKGSVDCKIMEYLSRSGATACPCTQSREERCEMDADTLFGQSIAAQLRSMDKRTNATAKVKIQQILLELQFPDNVPKHS